VSVVVLTALRLCLRYLTRAPTPETNSRAVALFAKAAHAGLYILLLLVLWMAYGDAHSSAGPEGRLRHERFRLAQAAHVGLGICSPR
jgi:cytochrome b561